MLALCILHLAHSGWRCWELFLGVCEDQREDWRVLWDLVLYTCHMTATELYLKKYDWVWATFELSLHLFFASGNARFSGSFRSVPWRSSCKTKVESKLSVSRCSSATSIRTWKSRAERLRPSTWFKLPLPCGIPFFRSQDSKSPGPTRCVCVCQLCYVV